VSPADRRSTRSPVKFVPAPLYPIIDTPGDLGAVERIVRGVLEAGVPWLQLRCKGTPASSFLAAATALVRRAAAAGCRVIVNDRLDVAVASGAAGVHLGQGDLPLAVARRIVGDRLVIGVSTHDEAEGRAAAEGGADYVGFGPMFTTASKADALAPRTLDALRGLRAAIRIPIVAIGGMDAASAGAVLDAGADAVAMIGALSSAPDPRAFTVRLLARRGRAR
jgi:thiamine-phosphate pyrophosphorylase